MLFFWSQISMEHNIEVILAHRDVSGHRRVHTVLENEIFNKSRTESETLISRGWYLLRLYAVPAFILAKICKIILKNVNKVLKNNCHSYDKRDSFSLSRLFGLPNECNNFNNNFPLDHVLFIYFCFSQHEFIYKTYLLR